VSGVFLVFPTGYLPPAQQLHKAVLEPVPGPHTALIFSASNYPLRSTSAMLPEVTCSKSAFHLFSACSPVLQACKALCSL